tara:strand:- start:407 stop:697 length:291 start_codon:yes stop_codon:yes gene_type:complete
MTITPLRPSAKSRYTHVFVDEYGDLRTSETYDDAYDALEALTESPWSWGEYRYTARLDSNGPSRENMAEEAEALRDQWAAERREEIRLTRWYGGMR